MVTYGPKKPKLESISIPKWVVANTRNFYTFLSEDKLSAQSAIQDYLAYTVKTMELIARFDWKSIFMYNNEFKKLQAIYKFSWSLDSTHLHMVLLQPKCKPNPTTVTTKPSASTTNQQTAFARFMPDGRVICRNFHGLKGCALLNCNFPCEITFGIPRIILGIPRNHRCELSR